ncbi:putative transcription factor C3H family [Dioscorea sansibarensis]
MYGQGNFTFRPAPPAPLPPYPQVSPAPGAPFHQVPPGAPAPAPPFIHQSLPCPPPPQAPIGPLPVAYQHSSLAPQTTHLSTSLPVNMSQHHINPPQIIHGRTPIVPSFPHVSSSYPPTMANQNVHYAMQLMTSSRVPPPPLASSQGQVLYRPPQLPSPGIQHLSTPPPPPPPNFSPVTHSKLTFFSQNPVGDAHAPSPLLPPPPPPPSSPPPLPPSPPPPSSPRANALPIISEPLPKASPEKPLQCDVVDGLLESACLTDDKSKVEKKLSLVEEKASGGFPSTPPRPADTETVKIIDVLCQFIAKVGPSFETEAREKEANNPRFSFLFGGEPGSAAAIGHEYFQWMKKKYCIRPLNEQVSASFGDNSFNKGAILPADSDVDMEDDVSQPEVDQTLGQLNRASARESVTASSFVPIGDESNSAPECTREDLKQEIAMPNNASCSGTSTLLHCDQDEDNSPFIEDLSPVRMAPHTAECVRPVTGESNIVLDVSPAEAVGKMGEVQRFHIEDGSSFRLIQSYASEESSEEDERKHPADATLAMVSSTVEMGISGSHQVLAKESVYCKNSSQKSSSSSGMHNSSPDTRSAIIQGFPDQDEKHAPERTGIANPPQQNDNNARDSLGQKPESAKLVKKDDFPLEVDEFGRLVKKAESDTESDGKQYGKARGKRRSQKRSRSPQENRWRQRSCSPRRGNKRRRSRRSRSRSKSPSTRQQKAQPRECFNYIRGRCFRGGSCRFSHSGSVRYRSRQQDFGDRPQENGDHNALNDGSYSESSDQTKLHVTELDADKWNSAPGEEAKDAESFREHSLAGINSVKDEAMGAGLRKTLVTVDEHRSTCVTEQSSNEPRILQELQDRNAYSIEEAKKIQPMVQSSQPQQFDCLPIQSPPAGNDQSLHDETPEPGSGDVRASHHSQAISACDKTKESQPAQSYPNQSPVCQLHPIQSQPPKDFTPSRFLASSVPLPSQQLLAAHVELPNLRHLNDPSAPFSMHHPENLAPPATSSDSHYGSKDKFTSFRPPIPSDYHSQRGHVNSAWSNVAPLPPPPPPPPSHMHGLPPRPSLPAGGYSSQMQPYIFPPTNEFSTTSTVKSNSPGEVIHPQGTDHHQSFHSVARYLPPMDDARERPSTVGLQQNQAPNREEQFSHRGAPEVSLDSQGDPHIGLQSFPPEDRGTFSGLGLTSSTSFPQVNIMQPQARTLFGDHGPPPVFSREEFVNPVRNLVYSHYQAERNENHPSNADFHSKLDPSFQRFPSVFHEKTLPPHLHDPLMPKISRSTHYNPFASTFEQPHSSLKIGSSVSIQERDAAYKTRYDLSFSSGHFLAGELGSRITATLGDSSIHTYRQETSVEMLSSVQKQSVKDPAAGDPYDPLSDSIEPSSTMFRVSNHAQEQNSVINKLSSLPRVANMEEDGGQNARLAPMHKLDLDELGEVATEAEGGAVENGSPQPGYDKDWSPGFPTGVQNAAAGEIEIDQVRSPGTSKKSKDSRSMKLFKVTLADFVKEVLKPSWRQGNMSKEAFKTIVKKTVDKVSGAMAGHQIPKSQAKINHYIESSRKKLTKLVMGYVEKYVKA